ncbi:30S ribosomal protein S7 [Candidatus Kaiserbacteria bacterium CG10_big_fil_rev_8_21_14_0_10_43_70]|uniref:Small ribosomal subunit protein uS7 n=1 Tax=Candidatus Kaiserbacteria bacterium CG10_big_fil_rev_8_21_14_0_10_43_70 TaxID=1974605 RepID=A0A2H0UJK0_9BACT|nr:MAG: 30S ribosomal protein S7 [Candidatus Kaiserbacteria bacterium CG10_big_fil_rev_8_21_14_0_10_43_70]
MRRPLKKKPVIKPDDVYGSVKVAKLVNYVMERGKKDTARRVVYEAFEILKKDGDPVVIFEEALKNVEPLMEVRSRRVGGANYQVPREVRPERRMSLALRWIIGAAKSKTGTSMSIRLANEILTASKGEGEAVTKRENTHKMAEANKAFAHFAW